MKFKEVHSHKKSRSELSNNPLKREVEVIVDTNFSLDTRASNTGAAPTRVRQISAKSLLAGGSRRNGVHVHTTKIPVASFTIELPVGHKHPLSAATSVPASQDLILLTAANPRRVGVNSAEIN